jgi:hypothetical protein
MRVKAAAAVAAVFYWLFCRFRKLYPFSNTASPGFKRSSMIPAEPARAACPRHRSFGWIPGNLCGLSKGYFATTFLSSSPPCPATQQGLPELGWKTLADICRADPPRPVVANMPRLEPLGRNRVKSGDRREKWNAFRNVTFIPNSAG